MRGKRVVIFHGEGGRETLAAALAARGAQVDHAVCYRRAAPSAARGTADALREGRVHAVTVTSSEGVDNLCDVAAKRGGSCCRASRCSRHTPASPRAHDRTDSMPVETGAGDAGLIAGLLAWAPRRKRARNRGANCRIQPRGFQMSAEIIVTANAARLPVRAAAPRLPLPRLPPCRRQARLLAAEGARIPAWCRAAER